MREDRNIKKIYKKIIQNPPKENTNTDLASPKSRGISREKKYAHGTPRAQGTV